MTPRRMNATLELAEKDRRLEQAESLNLATLAARCDPEAIQDEIKALTRDK